MVITEESRLNDQFETGSFELRCEPTIEEEIYAAYLRGFSEGFALGYQSAMDQVEQFDPQYD